MAHKKGQVTVVICMGSSCFSRGNNNTLQVLKTYVAHKGLDDQVLLQGKLCEACCCEGPHMSIDDVRYEKANMTTAVDILEHHLQRAGVN
jgi:NADH:ubiquinone oxidoreductase subunit E